MRTLLGMVAATVLAWIVVIGLVLLGSWVWHEGGAPALAGALCATAFLVAMVWIASER